MFTKFLNTGFDKMLEEAHLSNAMKLKVYDPILAIISKYCKDHGLHMGDYKDNHVFSIYGSHIFRHANNISNEIAELTPFVKLNTNIRNKEFTIWVDSKRLIGLYNLDKAFGPIIKKLGRIPPFIDLISIYRDMYNPATYSGLELHRASEKSIWDSFRKTHLTKKTSIISKKSERIGISQPNKYVDMVLDWLTDIPIDYVILGYVGLAMTSSNQLTSNRPIQIIVSSTEWAIKLIKKHIATNVTGACKIGVKKHLIDLVKDPRLVKYSVYVEQNNSDMQHVCEIFNSGEYEAIPFFIVDGYRIATVPVILRFLFLDIYTITKIEFHTKKNHQKSRRSILKYIGIAHNIFDIEEKIPDDDRNMPDFMGVIISKILYIKKHKGGYPYSPVQYKKSNGNYRII